MNGLPPPRRPGPAVALGVLALHALLVLLWSRSTGHRWVEVVAPTTALQWVRLPPLPPAMPTPATAQPPRHRTAAAAQMNGFRACKRCRPDATPGSPEWNLRADAVARAMRLIADGLVDREGVGGLAARLGYSERQVHQIGRAHV